ncbi:hypothetical protein [Rhizobium mayense]|uniref:hypothetical protein n=1 Tax=Rhizobium mayense TaxID=1312184 RepID=UPI0032E4C166
MPLIEYEPSLAVADPLRIDANMSTIRTEEVTVSVPASTSSMPRGEYWKPPPRGTDSRSRAKDFRGRPNIT